MPARWRYALVVVPDIPVNEPFALCWLRRDLRLHDNTALHMALQSGLPVLPVFVFDTDILNKLPDRDDARVTFINKTLNLLKANLEQAGSSLLLCHGQPTTVWKQLAENGYLKAVYAARDYEPAAIARDAEIAQLMAAKGVSFRLCKDQVLFEETEVVKPDGSPYTVFTHYSKRWLALFQRQQPTPCPSENLLKKLLSVAPLPFLSLYQLGFVPSAIPVPPPNLSPGILAGYAANRNLPAVSGTTKLGIHLRFGTISVRQVASVAAEHPSLLNELIWREFFMQILWHFPQVVSHSFKTKYDRIPWLNNTQHFERWCSGLTGIPLVDAGMRELAATGFMHNRVRMVVASFLVKNLLTDWRWGEAWFARKLLDYDLAANNGNWQWAAGCGTDAAPYFRVFSPEAQATKFDPEGRYIRQWVPEFGTAKYPAPVVSPEASRKRCLEVYREALAESQV